MKAPALAEAAIDLVRLAGLYPAGVLAEVVNPDGSMARMGQLLDFAASHGLLAISIRPASYEPRRGGPR